MDNWHIFVAAAGGAFLRELWKQFRDWQKRRLDRPPHERNGLIINDWTVRSVQIGVPTVVLGFIAFGILFIVLAGNGLWPVGW